MALARALYAVRFVTVLDEPNSNLDSEGEEALVDAMLAVRRRGGIVVVVTHRPTALAGVDLVAVMIDGRLQAFGPKEDDHAADDPAGAAAIVQRCADGLPVSIGGGTMGHRAPERGVSVAAAT